MSILHLPGKISLIIVSVFKELSELTEQQAFRSPIFHSLVLMVLVHLVTGCARIAYNLMAEVKFYKMLLSQESLQSFLLDKNLIINAEKANRLGIRCKNQNCSNPLSGFYDSKRRRNLSNIKGEILLEEGQNIFTINTLRCRICSTYLSPRIDGFLSYRDSLGRANCKLAPEKILQIMFHWASQRKIKDSSELLDVSKQIIIDWYNHCRALCTNSNVTHHAQRNLGGGGVIQNQDETPECVVQIDECLLRGKRLYNRGRMLEGDQNITIEEREEWRALNEDNLLDHTRNYGMRIDGPWIFGMVECHKNDDGSYSSGEIRLFKVDRRDAATLLPLIRNNVQRGSMIWSDEWAAYRAIGRDDDGLLHNTVNHSQRFITDTGVHTQNIERSWSSLKLKILKNMKGTSVGLLESHLDEFMWRSRGPSGIYQIFERVIDEAGIQNPIQF